MSRAAGGAGPDEAYNAAAGGSRVGAGLASLLPPGVVVVTRTRDVSRELPEGEREAVAASVPSRVAEFATGRSCAHDALDRLGVPAATIGRGGRGEPLWPDGVVGSITHCEGLRAAAVARAGDVAGLGIDAEPHLPLPEEVVELTLTPPERRRLAKLHRAAPGVAWGRVVFSLKESVYKLWYPLRHEWLGFEEVDTMVLPDGAFTVELPRPLSAAGARVTTVRGRWTVTAGRVLTATVLEEP